MSGEDEQVHIKYWFSRLQLEQQEETYIEALRYKQMSVEEKMAYYGYMPHAHLNFVVATLCGEEVLLPYTEMADVLKHPGHNGYAPDAELTYEYIGLRSNAPGLVIKPYTLELAKELLQ